MPLTVVPRGLPRWLIFGLVACMLTGALMALAAARYYPASRAALAARDELRDVQALLRENRLDTSEARLTAAEARLDEAERHLRRLRRAIDDPLLSAARRAPFLGDSVRATAELTSMGLDGVQVGREAIEVTRTYQRLRERDDGSLTERTEEILAQMEQPMEAVGEGLERIHARRARVTGILLPPALVRAIEEFDDDVRELDELHRTYRDMAAFLPRFLGFQGPKTYLVLAQNNAELMPTGGLISVYGVITVEEGRITHRRFEDAVRFGGHWMERTDTYIAPPAPLRRYLLRDMSWNLAVSNWSPHFPEAAAKAARFFELAGGQPVDGVIGINVHTIEELLGVTGPVTIDAYGETVTAENALDVIEEHTRSGREPGDDRKALVGLLAEELLSRMAAPPPGRWTPLLEALQRLRDERQLLLYFDDAPMQRLAERLGLDGGLVTPDGDYLMLVDASVNSTKLNMVLDRASDVRVRLDEFGVAQHRVTSWYENNLPAWAAGRDPTLVRRLMLGGVYGGYVRLLVPAGSALERVTINGREAGPEEVSHEHGKIAFGRFFSVPSGATATVGFSYVTRGVVRVDAGVFEYRLFLQKQSGTEAIPVRLQVQLPRGAEVESAELDGHAVHALYRIATDLTQDRELVIRYRID